MAIDTSIGRRKGVLESLVQRFFTAVEQPGPPATDEIGKNDFEVRGKGKITYKLAGVRS